MEDTSSDTFTNQNTRNNLEMQKYILDQVFKNTRELEAFLNYNSKFKNALMEMIQSYYGGHDERLKYYYTILKDSIRNIENNTTNFNKNFQSIQNTNPISTKDDYNSVFAEKNNEIYESLLKMEFNHKYNFTISIFKPLLDMNKDEMLRDILKEDYIMQIKNTSQQVIDKVNEIPTTLIEEINKKFNPNLQISMDDKNENYRSINIIIMNSFNIMLRISNEHPMMFKFSVALPDEYTTIIPQTDRKDRKFINILKKNKIEDKSKYQVIRKIALLVEDRFHISLRYGKYSFKMGFYLFIHWISNFQDIFKKKCFFCKQIAKFNAQDKCFYPPYYKFMDLESEHFFHEECYNYLNGSSI